VHILKQDKVGKSLPSLNPQTIFSLANPT